MILIAFPGTILRVAGVRPQSVTGRLTTVVRLLGARHVVEAVALERFPTRRGAFAAATVDGLHAASLVVLARMFPARARLARADCAIALGFGLTTAACAVAAR